MIGISKLYCASIEASDPLRYGRKTDKLPSHLQQFSKDPKPVIVWNTTARCNLRCVHCYAQSNASEKDKELTHPQGITLLEQIADFGCPVVLFSGGEPLLRPDLPDLAAHARSLGLRTVVSTNGILIDEKMAQNLARAKLDYVGISLDGMADTHDRFRGQPGAFQASLAGIRQCRKAGLKVGVRFTLNRFNVTEVPQIFDLLEDEDVPRACFYHLVYTGRGQTMINDDLTHAQRREVVDLIIDRTADLHRRGIQKEILTVDNHTDGPYLYLRLLQEGKNKQAQQVLSLLKMNGGNRSGIGIGCVSWDGSVYADQFWRHYSIGNVRQKSFTQIWQGDDPLLEKLRDRKKHLKGRCAACKFLDICNGNFRVRAEAATGDLWAPDPACYLTDQEIGIST